ncbi:MAG: T9SS type A sorting domain-containing protein [Flavobacteriales bacterium]|nr:T9SS type A sorting domain-containing protein [Flavobacteriales bacterium]
MRRFNPAHDELFLQLSDDEPKDLIILDPSGRRIRTWSSVMGPLVHLPINELATGVYWVRASDGESSSTKKLIIH